MIIMQNTKQMTEAEHMEQLVDNIASYDLDKFVTTPSGRKYGTPFSFKKRAPRELAERHQDFWGADYVARLTHPQATYLAQLLAKEYNAPLELRSVDTAMEVHDAEKDSKERAQGWEQNREVLFRLDDSLWAIPHPEVVPEEGRLVYNINGSVGKITKIARGKASVKTSEQNIEGGIKAEGDDIFSVLRSAKVLRNHKVETRGGVMRFDDPDYRDIASVGSGWDGGGGCFGAGAYGPSDGDSRGLAVPEIVRKE